MDVFLIYFDNGEDYADHFNWTSEGYFTSLENAEKYLTNVEGYIRDQHSKEPRWIKSKSLGNDYATIECLKRIK